MKKSIMILLLSLIFDCQELDEFDLKKSELFEVVSCEIETCDTISLIKNTKAPYGYVIDNDDYKVGDIVLVDYKNDDIFNIVKVNK